MLGNMRVTILVLRIILELMKNMSIIESEKKDTAIEELTILHIAILILQFCCFKSRIIIQCLNILT